MKVIKIPASGVHSAFQQHQNISSENSSNMPPGVKVVKLSAASATATNQRVAYTSQVIFSYRKICENILIIININENYIKFMFNKLILMRLI